MTDTNYETNMTLLDVIKLEQQELTLRRGGWFNEAASVQSLARALRTGQLTRRELHTSDRKVRCVAGRCIGL